MCCPIQILICELPSHSNKPAAVISTAGIWTGDSWTGNIWTAHTFHTLLLDRLGRPHGTFSYFGNNPNHQPQAQIPIFCPGHVL